jgi:hypothetical protein
VINIGAATLATFTTLRYAVSLPQFEPVIATLTAMTRVTNLARAPIRQEVVVPNWHYYLRWLGESPFFLSSFSGSPIAWLSVGSNGCTDSGGRERNAISDRWA